MLGTPAMNQMLLIASTINLVVNSIGLQLRNRDVM